MENGTKKKWNQDTIGRVLCIIQETLYSMALYREIRPNERNNDFYDPFLREFWISISNNAIMMAVINWCKVFGAEKNNRTHYSHFVETEHFNKKILGISFQEYADSMLNVRDKFAAHEDKEEERKEIPSFDIAVRVMAAFVETVEEEYNVPSIPSIQTTYEAYKLQIRDCLCKCEIDWAIPDLEE